VSPRPAGLTDSSTGAAERFGYVFDVHLTSFERQMVDDTAAVAK
jgi:hypothetical protein